MRNDRQGNNWEWETNFKGLARDVRTSIRELPGQVSSSLRESLEMFLESLPTFSTRTDRSEEEKE